MNFMRRIPKTLYLLGAVFALIIIPFILFEAPINHFITTHLQAETTPRLTLGAILFGALSLDLFLPVPSSLVSTACGLSFGLLKGFLLSFMAMNLSCMLGYLFGRICTEKAKTMVGEKEFVTLQTLFQRYGTLFLIALRTAPVLAEASVLFAGISRTPPLKTATLLLFGNATVSLIYTLVGHYGRSTDAMIPAFIASLAVSALFMLPLALQSREKVH